MKIKGYILEKLKSKRGGKRTLAGAKKKYSEETTTVSFRVPKSKVFEIKELVQAKLLGYKKA